MPSSRAAAKIAIQEVTVLSWQMSPRMATHRRLIAQQVMNVPQLFYCHPYHVLLASSRAHQAQMDQLATNALLVNTAPSRELSPLSIALISSTASKEPPPQLDV